MATAKPVKFKTSTSTPSLAPFAVYDAPEYFSPPIDVSEEPSPVEDSVNKFRLYHLVMHTTTANTPEISHYHLYAHESRTGDDIESRVDAYKTYGYKQLDSSTITGFMLKVYRINPMISNTSMTQVTCYHKFQPKKDKVFLNGPLKNNAFLQKKGGMYV